MNNNVSVDSLSAFEPMPSSMPTPSDYDFLLDLQQKLETIDAQMRKLSPEEFMPIYAMLLEEHCKRERLDVVEQFEMLAKTAKKINDELGRY